MPDLSTLLLIASVIVFAIDAFLSKSLVSVGLTLFAGFFLARLF